MADFGQRTDRDVAADVVACLFMAKLLPRDTNVLNRITMLTGVGRDEIGEALARVEGNHGHVHLSLPPESSPEQGGDVLELRRRRKQTEYQPRPDGMRPPAGRKRPKKVIGGVVHLFCTGGPDHPNGHWLPVNAFALRSDRPWSRRSKCPNCSIADQRRRRVTVAALDSLRSAGIELDPADAHAPLRCVGCGQPIVVGDGVDHSSCQAVS